MIKTILFFFSIGILLTVLFQIVTATLPVNWNTLGTVLLLGITALMIGDEA